MFKVRTTRRNVKRSGSITTEDTAQVGSSESTPPTAEVVSKPQHSFVENEMNKGFNMLFHAESTNNQQKPWLRLERGIRLQKLRAFAEEYPGLSDEEKESLNRVLVKANDAKLLNTKQQIQYEEGKVLAIRGLRMTRVGDLPATFKIDVTRPTKKKGKEDE